jgi:hypothetical protein
MLERLGTVCDSRGRGIWRALILCTGQGFAYHRYTLAAFVLLWMAIQLTIAIRKGAPSMKIVAITGLAVGMLVRVPLSAQTILQMHPVNPFIPALENDPSRIGSDRLKKTK